MRPACGLEAPYTFFWCGISDENRDQIPLTSILMSDLSDFPNTDFELIRSRKNALVKPAPRDDPFENFFLRSETPGPNGENF